MLMARHLNIVDLIFEEQIVGGHEQVSPRPTKGRFETPVVGRARKNSMKQAISLTESSSSTTVESINGVLHISKVSIGAAPTGQLCNLGLNTAAEVQCLLKIVDRGSQKFEPHTRGRHWLTHETAAAGTSPGLDIAFRLKQRQSFLHGLAANSQLLGQRPLRGKSHAHGDLTALNLSAEQLSELHARAG